MKKLKALIIDDERAARAEIRFMLKNYPEGIVLAEAANADEAQSLIDLLKPDLIFLDIQMPGRSGFDLLEGLSMVPQVIFVTAYDSYAIKAFEVSAMDYLLKPVRAERFEMAMKKVMAIAVSGEHLPGIFVRDKGTGQFIRWQDVQLVESMDNYVRLHLGEKQFMTKSSLNKLEEVLTAHGFFRANRAELFNMAYFALSRQDEPGEVVLLRTGEELRLSERQAVKFRRLLKDKMN